LGLNATDAGKSPTVIVSVTSPVATVITDTVSVLELVTYAFSPLGLNATEYGPLPTVIVSTTAGAANAGVVTGATSIKVAAASESEDFFIVVNVVMGLKIFPFSWQSSSQPYRTTVLLDLRRVNSFWTIESGCGQPETFSAICRSEERRRKTENRGPNF
jgi:hypothetical protein